jgi:hypothetical protein
MKYRSSRARTAVEHCTNQVGQMSDAKGDVSNTGREQLLENMLEDGSVADRH